MNPARPPPRQRTQLAALPKKTRTGRFRHSALGQQGRCQGAQGGTTGGQGRWRPGGADKPDERRAGQDHRAPRRAPRGRRAHRAGGGGRGPRRRDGEGGWDWSGPPGAARPGSRAGPEPAPRTTVRAGRGPRQGGPWAGSAAPAGPPEREPEAGPGDGPLPHALSTLVGLPTPPGQPFDFLSSYVLATPSQIFASWG